VKALSIKQPWAWLICAGWKDIENRDWSTSFRGRIYVHAGKRWDSYPNDYRDLETIAHSDPDLLDALVNYCAFDRNSPLKVGVILGEVDVTDCVTQSQSPWFVGPYGFVLANPVAYDKPIPYKGKLGFFEVDKVVPKEG
jgi:hypothetical protein